VNTTLLLIGAVLAIVLVIAALAIFLYLIGSVVKHIAETLQEKIAAGAAEVSQHVAAIGPAAESLRSGFNSIAR
jgi:hypothetical protein